MQADAGPDPMGRLAIGMAWHGITQLRLQAAIVMAWHLRVGSAWEQWRDWAEEQREDTLG